MARLVLILSGIPILQYVYAFFNHFLIKLTLICASSVFDDGRRPCFFDSVFRFKEIVKFNGIYAVLFRRAIICEIAITFRFFVVRKGFQNLFIVFEREMALDDVARTGTIVDARVSSELLKNIFFVKAPMHDGAVIVRHGRVLGAGCMLPLSKNVNLSRDLGMRHRAGIGMSENSDAVVVIVSEETGSISVAIGGMLKRHLKPETLENLLRNELLPREEDSEDRLKFNLLNLLRSKKNGGEEDA